MSKPQILECTLRDGSYAINFQFTQRDTQNILKALELAGFNMIEIGHGIGLGASDKELGVAAETDEVYLKTAAETLQKASWGMFCIPGIAELYHIDMAADYGMKFIRIGTNVEDYALAQPFIQKAKKYGMLVCSNFMKSYASSPKDFAKCALETEKYGSDVIYIVDSAGGMLPNELEQYVRTIRDQSPTLRLGFHGHHNLGLGVANALKAIELGVEIIDTSLQGMGRSAGNTPTEQLLCVLLRAGIDLGIDPIDVMDICETYIQPLFKANAWSAIDLVSGYALFHSSYMKTIEKYATKYRIDPRRLIIATCEKNKVSAPDELVENMAIELAKRHVHGSWRPSYHHYYGEEQKYKGHTTMSALFDNIFSKNSHKTAFIFDGDSLTYQQLMDKILGLIGFFKKMGVNTNDRIALRMPNCIEYLLCYLAGLFGGFTIVQINSGLSQKDVDYILDITTPKLMITNPSELSYEKDISHHLLKYHDQMISFISFTSGTTGRPKGIAHYGINFVLNALQFNNLTGIDENVRMLHIMPMGYTAGLLNTMISPLLAGGTIIVAPQFEAKTVNTLWEYAQQYQANALWLSPTMAAFLARLNRSEEIPQWVAKNIRHAFIGTAPLLESIKNQFEKTFNIECLESYGMSEVLLVSSNTFKYPRKNGSVGRILESVEIQARDERGHPKATGEEGELYIQSPFALKGYLCPESKEIISPLQNNWLPTGDFGYVDSDRNLFITGRIKDLIIRGGINISPRAVEEVLLQCEGIKDAIVMGKTHPFWGEEVIAFLIGENLDLKTIHSFCQAHLSPDHIPSEFKILSEFPRSNTGKVQKNILKELYLTPA